ncbi:NAD(P)-dependent oxidoreductase EC-YbbO [Methylophaga lonarensis MPL]|uniref:NAD(P)-dependent oxidoreductase EC-YbbO n=1 Tax=Methylophaga lonarensis MPL TaxID=1286106 RepID=M7PKD5_9GAMM|nr:SDR family NAD(P)-dependent oxidoreductase [Methylophaga lonarensis]EMR14320.1 NAD(P)-dependent oxidoreductase EC-YbbO [Methylophaga lonarensis MPL]
MKSILISGCSSGIGQCAALMLHQRGYQVIATVRRPEDAQPLEQAGIKTLLMDLNDSASIHKAVEDALSYAGQIDTLFNNAAYGQPGAVEDLSRTALEAQFQTNVIGTQELTNLVIRQMRQQGAGRIIYNSSVLGLVAMPYRGAYNASKYAIEGLADTLRLELHGTGIYISLIEPGPILSRFRQNAMKQYQQHIDKDSSAHKSVYQAMEARLTTEGPAAPFTLGPEAVVAKLIKAIESKRPKCRYFVTFPTYLFATLKRCLPQRLLDMLLRRIL